MADSFFTFAPDVRPICQIGISAIRQAEPDSWLDVSCYVHEAEVFRGRERFNERFEPGTASVTFHNGTGWADLGGTYVDVAAAELRPGRQIRIGVHGTWTPGLAPFTRWLYRGFIDQATPAYDPILHDVVTVNCIDALGEAGQTTAPQGPHQGVNETAAQRINRALDAVGWWGTKRKIDATPTTVQGTSLGARAIDHMSQAADSAGGVVFGDLDGDVVFRDIDWMLYDPDVPPDGTIGPGDPGAPPGDLPPYIDPTAGPVYDPDDPPAEHPPKVCVCADGDEGTLVEKGDNYRLYVKDGHLFYEASGTTWDMGPYAGGCTCVDPTPDGPERTDDEDEDGDYEISPFEPVELPPVFHVELLAWDDGGLDDVPAASVTVAGVTPGHDCLLVVLVNALGTVTNTTGLAPTVAGGSLDWAHRRDADQASDGASSFIIVAPVGRDDPGTFDVTVTWTAPSTSRSHIVTVWKVVAAVDDYLERFDAGVVLYATTDSDPPDEIEPGEGIQVVDLAGDRQPVDVDVATRTVDITIAQTLAEEGTEPYGASFEEANGPWITVPAGALEVAWADDFERADGDVGADWVLGVETGTGEAPQELAIVSGAAVGPSFTGVSPTPTGTISWATEVVGPDQFIEVVFDNWYSTVDAFANMRIEMYCFAGGGEPHSEARRATAFQQTMSGGQPQVLIETFTYLDNGTTSDGEDTVYLPYSGTTGTMTFRLDSYGDGTQVVTLNGAVVHSYVDTDTPFTYLGYQQGVWMAWRAASGRTSPRILSISGGGTGSDVVRKTSWVAGWRQGIATGLVMFSDVNFGPTDIQSAQACLVLESAETESGWRILGHDLRAALSGVTPAGTPGFDNAPRPGSLVVVFVGLTVSADVIDSVTVTGADFTRVHVQPKSGASWGQGAVYTAVAPLDLVADSWNVVVTHPEVESISVVVYEVAAPADVAPVGATASGVLGDHTAGSVDGADSITLSATGDAAAVVLAYLHVAADPDPASGAGTVDGDEWTEEYQSTGAQRGYFQTMSRALGQPESTSTDVHWADVQTGTADTYSAVQLAVEIKPGPSTTGAGLGVWLGGLTDPWNGTISSADAYDPITGLPIWTFP